MIKTISAKDLYKFKVITDAEISPDGTKMVYAVQWVAKKGESKYINLWTVSTNGSNDPIRFTTGDQIDFKPHWSPDGKQIALLSNRNAKNPKDFQVFLIPADGGEARQLTNIQGEFDSFAWAPDGKSLLCQFRRKDKEALERDENPDKEKLGIVARHINRVHFKLDDYGYLPEERWHIWKIDVADGSVQQLTDDVSYDELNPTWSPDGKHITFISNHSEDPDFNPDADDLFVLQVGTGKVMLIQTPEGSKKLPVFSPDGKWIAYIGQEGRGNEWKNNNLWIVPADGSGPAINLTGKLDVSVNAWTINDVGGFLEKAPIWSTDSQTIFFTVGRHGRTTLHAIDINGSEYKEIIDEPGVVSSVSMDRNRQAIGCVFASMVDPGQVWVKALGDDLTFKQLSTLHEKWMDKKELGQVEEVWFKGADGNDLQGWIIKPPDFDETKKYPSILEIHGGPLVQYGNYFMHEFCYLAAQGYVVYFCNPRGGQGYGEEHAKAIHDGKWGTFDFNDLMAWADYLEAQPYIDPDRMGVTGGSYGGYMTAWIIGHTDRFKAAVAQRCVSNLLSMWGSSDFNWSFQETFGNQAPYQNIEKLWECSPMKHIGSAKTPTMVIHSEQDLRCPIEQGEQVFVALKKLGVDTEFVIFPGEPHGLSRKGRTDRRVERLKSIRRWFDRYLKDN
jgi:dipeptidyl aminopeptidase/acylaminoacyl peptidase